VFTTGLPKIKKLRAGLFFTDFEFDILFCYYYYYYYYYYYHYHHHPYQCLQDMGLLSLYFICTVFHCYVCCLYGVMLYCFSVPSGFAYLNCFYVVFQFLYWFYNWNLCCSASTLKRLYYYYYYYYYYFIYLFLSGHISDYSTSPHKIVQKNKVCSYPEGIDLLQAQEPQQT